MESATSRIPSRLLLGDVPGGSGTRASSQTSERKMISPVCCWQDQKIRWDSLRRHYDSCPAINGTQWAFWVCAYTGKAFRKPEAFKTWLLRFKPQDQYIKIITGRYATVQEWVTDLKVLAMKRHLMAMLLKVRVFAPAFWERWVTLNGGNYLPDLNGITDLPETLRQCSQLVRTKDSFADRDFTISELVRLLHINVYAVPPQMDAFIYTDTTGSVPESSHVPDDVWHSEALDDTQMDLHMQAVIDAHGLFSAGTPNQFHPQQPGADDNEINEDLPTVYHWQRRH
jgi:hypothetical protein